MTVATGAQVRLFRRGAARPVGVRWAAPIACAGSVQAVAKRQRQRCLRPTSLDQVSSKARKRAPEQHRRGRGAHNTTRGHRHTRPEPTAGGGAASAHRRGAQHRRAGGPQAPGGRNTARGHQHTRGPLPPANRSNNELRVCLLTRANFASTHTLSTRPLLTHKHAHALLPATRLDASSATKVR